MFRKFVATMALALFAATSFAATVDTSGMTDSQVAELKAQAAKVVADNAKKAAGISMDANNPGAVVTLAATWGQQAAAAAEGFAKAMGIAAKELNVHINDFLKSDAGKLTAILIIWKVMGASVLQILVGLMFILAGLIMTRVIYLRLFTKGFEKVPYTRFFGAFTGERLVRIPKSFSDLHNEGEWLMMWVMIAMFIGTMGIGAAIIV